MFTSFASFFVERRTDLKNQKLVGEVVKHVEGDENGLVHVRVRGIHDDWPEEALPKMQMKGGFGSGNKGGTTNPTEQLPPVGSKIFCQFEDNSHYHGQYFGGSATDDKKNPEFTGKENYGHTSGMSDIGGGLSRTGTKEGEEFYERVHKTGTNYKLDKDGNFNLSAAKDHNVGAESGKMQFDKNHTVEAGGDGHLKFGGKLIIEASQIEFRHGGATSSTPITLGGGSPSKPGSRTKPTKRTRPTFAKPGMKV